MLVLGTVLLRAPLLRADSEEYFPFIRGDANHDGAVDIGDALFVLLDLFVGGDEHEEHHDQEVVFRKDASDANDDGTVDMSDAVYVLAFLFADGPAPGAPFPDPGEDPTADELDIEQTVPFQEIFVGGEARIEPQLDGRLDPREWLDARRIVLAEGRNPIELLLKNDERSLYVALTAPFDLLDERRPPELIILFGLDSGDHAIRVRPDARDPVDDLHVLRSPSKEPALTIEGLGAWEIDEREGGTTDPRVAFTLSDGRVTYEIQQPLQGRDSLDLQVRAGDTLPLGVRYTSSSGRRVSDWPDEFGQGHFGNLVIQGDVFEAQLQTFQVAEELLTLSLFAKEGLNELIVERRRDEVLDLLHALEETLRSDAYDEAREIHGQLVARVNPYSADAYVSREALEAGFLFDLVEQLRAIVYNGPSETEQCDGAFAPGIRNGIAYFFEEDFEGDVSDWTANGFWQRMTTGQLRSLPGWGQQTAGLGGSMRCFWYGQTDTGNYDNGERNSGSLLSPPFFVPSENAIVAFDSFEETEDHFIQYDRKQVHFSIDGGPWQGPIYYGQWSTWSRAQNNWRTMIADLPPETAGRCVRLRFRFDTVDEKFNQFRGWMVDNVTVYKSTAAMRWSFVGAPRGAPRPPPTSHSPVLVGDENNGQLFAFLIDDEGTPYMSAHDMHSDWSEWIELRSPVPLSPGSLSAASYSGPDSPGPNPRTHGDIRIVAHGRDDLLLYSTGFRPNRQGFFSPPPFTPVTSTPTVGKPAIISDGRKFHIVVAALGLRQRFLLHFESNSLTGSWTGPETIPGADPITPPALAVGFRAPGTIFNSWNGGDLHVAWVERNGRIEHSVKTEFGGFLSSPALSRQIRDGQPDLTEPSMVFFNNRVHIAVGEPGRQRLHYFHSDRDASWPDFFNASNSATVPHSGSFAPRLVEFFSHMLIFAPDAEGFVRFFRLENNLPSLSFEQSGLLQGFGGWIRTETDIEAARSMSEVYVATRPSDLAGPFPDERLDPRYLCASRALAHQTFDTLGLEFDEEPNCKRARQTRPTVPGPLNETTGCGNPSSSSINNVEQREAFSPPPDSPIWNHISYSRLGALLWTIPWDLWLETEIADGMRASLRGQGVVGRGGVRNFWMGYQDHGGDLDINLRPPVSPDFGRDGFLEDEFTHPFWPLPGSRFANHPFSGDHDWIYDWIPYRLGQAGQVDGDPKLEWIRDVMYGGQEFSRGRRRE